MKQISGKEFCKLLEKRGWELKRTQGSHFIYWHDVINEKISVPIHGNKDLKIGLLKTIMKIAHISESDL